MQKSLSPCSLSTGLEVTLRITLALQLGWQLGGERQFRLGMAMRHILPMSIDANRSAYPHIFAHYPYHSAFAASAWPLVPYLDGIGSLDSRGRRRMQILDEEEGRRTQASKDTWQFLFNTLRWLHYSTIVLHIVLCTWSCFVRMFHQNISHIQPSVLYFSVVWIRKYR